MAQFTTDIALDKSATLGAGTGSGVMKIVDLCEFYSERGGGVRSYLAKLGEAASRHGHEVVVVAPGPRDETRRVNGTTLMRYAAPPMPYDPTYHLPWRVDRMWSYARQQRPDVLQVSSPFLPAVVAKGLNFVPVRSYVYHSDPIGCYVEYNLRSHLPSRVAEQVRRPFWGWMRSISNMCDATIVAGKWLERVLVGQGCPRVHTIPFGIRHEDFSPSRRDAALRARLLGQYSDRPEAKLLLIAGRLAMDKRQHLLVDATQQLVRRRPIALVVLGDGPERTRLVQRAAGLPQVTFLPFTKDRTQYAALLASSDVLLHGSRCETYGFLLAEALASGTPVVVPDAGGAAAIARPSCSEKYSPLGKAADVAAAIERLLNRPQHELQDAAIDEAGRQPGVDEHFEGLFELYERLTTERMR